MERSCLYGGRHTGRPRPPVMADGVTSTFPVGRARCGARPCVCWVERERAATEMDGAGTRG
eukprot:7375966-Prymnesium_polylepis.1